MSQIKEDKNKEVKSKEVKEVSKNAPNAIEASRITTARVIALMLKTASQLYY